MSTCRMTIPSFKFLLQKSLGLTRAVETVRMTEHILCATHMDIAKHVAKMF